MVWVLWRQHRTQALATAGFLAVLGVYVLAAGDGAGQVLSWLPLAPLLAGIFWGAPLLSREFERGTHRLAWTQSVTRQRWLLSKLGGLSLVVTATGLVLGLMVDAWMTEYDENRFGTIAFFGGSGVAVGAWWLFAFLLGAAAGGVLRRLLPALGVTIAVFMIALFAIFQLRENYAEPLRMESLDPGPGNYVTHSTWLDPSGAEVMVPSACSDTPDAIYMDCVAEAGYSFVYYYHPADRYWRFQWTETGILLLGAVLLAGPVMYRVLRRPV